MQRDVIDAKKRLRDEMKAARRALSPHQRATKSARITQNFLELDSFANWSAFFIYVSYLNEVSTRGLIRTLLERDAVVTVPKIVESPRMEAQRIENWEQLRPGKFGILEPAGSRPYDEALDVCITPSLAFSETGQRLGYGKGHYDRFLETRPGLLTVGFAFECQIVERVPTEPTDRSMDLIVSEQRVIQVQRNSQQR